MKNVEHILLLVVLLVVSGVVMGEVERESVIRHEEEDYSFEIPSLWKYDDFGPGSYSSPDGNIVFNIGPIRSEVFAETENTLLERLNSLLFDLRTSPDYNELSVENIVVDGLDAKRVIFTYHDAGDAYTPAFTLKQELILTEDCGGNSYFIYYISSDSSFDSNKPVFDEVTNSVNWNCDNEEVEGQTGHVGGYYSFAKLALFAFFLIAFIIACPRRPAN